jgi:hypothetical protein
MKTRILKLARVRAHLDAGARTLFFKADGHARRRPYLFFGCEAVPDFDGEEAWFRAERAPKGDWRVVQRVNADGTPYADPSVLHA